MAELTIEQKAKAYDEALEKAHQLCTYPTTKPFISDLQDLFPELKESEDEKIMKEIKAFIRSRGSQITQSKTDAWIAWLEKQGEQKPVAKYKVGDTVYYDSFGRLVSFVIANIVEDGTDNPMYEDKDGNSVFQNDIVEQNTAWSEDDEKKTNYLIGLLQNSTMHNPALRTTNEELENWLKELKDRIQTQPTWKPTDEQVEALETYLYNPQYISSSEDKRLNLVESLYEQLKKLMEE